MFSIFFNFFDQLDQHILALVDAHGGWTHAILFVLLTCEVGLVVFPFLPGETLLFAAGALAALDALHLPTLLIGFAIAAVLGNLMGYGIGRQFRFAVAEGRKIPLLNPANLERTKAYFQRNPKKALVVTRFIPIVRSIAPFVAGASCMNFGQFARYSVLGGTGWAVLCTMVGYMFGHLPIVRENFGLGILAIVVVACVPALYAVAVRPRRPRPE
ncbi:MAG: VTT domain-containing protein [Candidatus Hydrogenedentes bacterium]|nr:VTT domain-containing protein [Candidatus Hydrogenedentota bacterium]